MTKCNNKSIRLNDQVYNYINNFEGDGFNQKFENIIIFAMKTEKDRKLRIKHLDKEIEDRESIVKRLSEKIRNLRIVLDDLNVIFETVDKMKSEVK